MLTRFVFVVLVFLSANAFAGKIEHASVAHKDGVYTLALSVLIAARLDPVHKIVTDYDELHRISDTLIETKRLSEPDAEEIQRRLVVRTCVLVFCFTATMTEDVVEGDDAIITTIIPEHSDYKSGETRWEVSAVDETHSRISLFCELEPDFWIPPVVGPYLLKRKMMSIAKKTIVNIETLANDA